MKIKLIRAICLSLAIVSVTAGITCELKDTDSEYKKTNAVLVFSIQE